MECSITCTTADEACRRSALRALGVSNKSLLAIAIDGPLRPSLSVEFKYRAAECLLSRGAFQKRGKPGQSHAGSGPELHRHASLLAEIVLSESNIEAARSPFAAHTTAIYEAFPNLFLGVMCDECSYPDRPTKRRHWTDTLFPLVQPRVDYLLSALLPHRNQNGFSKIDGHEPIAAYTCAITAVCAAAGVAVAVGALEDGFMVLPPRKFWGSSADGGLWAERELRDNFRKYRPEENCLPNADLFEGHVRWP